MFSGYEIGFYGNFEVVDIVHVDRGAPLSQRYAGEQIGSRYLCIGSFITFCAIRYGKTGAFVVYR